MTGEWVEKRVAELEVGDDVRDFGPVLYPPDSGDRSPETIVLYTADEGWPNGYSHGWPAHARVDVRRPVEITVAQSYGQSYNVFVGLKRVGVLCKDHAEEYAERLRHSADERAKALGQ